MNRSEQSRCWADASPSGWLGHEHIATAHIYLHGDMKQTGRAIARVTPPGATPGRYQPPDPLLTFLDGQ